VVTIALLVVALGQFAGSSTGELRLTVRDPSGLPLQCSVELISESTAVRQDLQTDADGRVAAKRLPFGTYRLAVVRDGFAPVSELIEIRSALPIDRRVTLTVAAVQAQVTVSADATLLDLHQTTAVNRIGGDALQQRTTALPGRGIADLVNTQPGWLLEANGILHPRGSEYQTQYVLDGLPLTDNRSPGFAPEIDADDVHAMTILTGGYPAEYGRKLGGVIEVATAGQARQGLHGSAGASLGSFATRGGDAAAEYGWPRATLSVTAGAAETDRYLDPPIEENATNHGSTSHVAVHVERDATDADRLGAIVRHGAAHFLVPNERVQQEAGQRQDRESEETAAQFSYQRILSAPVVVDVRGMVRDLSARLWSNEHATPVAAQQDRGFRDLYLKATAAGHAGIHEWKAGGDLAAGTVRERFSYLIRDASAFEPGTPAAFAFDDRRADREAALFAQDQVRWRRWTVNAGIRWDRYRLATEDTAISPRLGIAWSAPAGDFVLRGSYDRAFQTPAVENLLLTSSPAVDTLTANVLRLPVPPSRGNFYELGASKTAAGKIRLDATWFTRRIDDFADDDLLLNTGVSFPISFRRARISGTELRLDVPHWNAFSGSIGYAFMRGVGELPITGGLLLGDEAAALLTSTDQFPITQDQRHTIRGRVVYRVTPAAWIAMAGSYGSGLPVEFEGDRDEAIAQYGERIVDRVDFDAGRVRPAWSLDASGSVALVRRAARALRVQVDARNITNRLNVINFAGVFSGTALGPPRSVAVRVRVDF
jgi:TonB-dependent receptor-like protein/carboxypeptidase family protein